MKNAPSASSAIRSAPRNVAVRRNGSGWSLFAAASDVPGFFPTKAAAVAAAKRALAREGGVLTIHQANGAVREMLTVGRNAALRLNGIEGVAMNTTSRRLLRDVQSSGMNPAQQRSAISAAFKK